MSRSYRKHFITDQSYNSKTPKFFKKQANRKIRRTKDVPDGNRYKRYYDSWSICDYKSLIDPEAWWMKDEPWKVISK